MLDRSRSLGVALLLTLSATPAAAQFTAVVEAPKRAPAASATVAATAGARADSAGRTRLADMKAWVDSAAGVAAPAGPVVAADTTVRWDSAGGEVVATRRDTPTVDRAGMPAPDTATGLPALAVAGLLMLGAGTWFLRRARA